MIARDEEHIITRAFESMKNIITSYYICDTGSKDNTINVIQNWMEEHKIPGEVFQEEWKNFGYNKSLLLKNARNHQNKVISNADYYVWLDCDEVWIKDKNDPLSYLTTEDALKLYHELNSKIQFNIFMILTLYGGVQYYRWNICRNNQLYKWEQPVHEYLVATENGNTSNIEWIYLLARKEGNSSKNPNRYENDAKMFLEYLENYPDEPRATFYLAQTYESFDIEKSIEWYKKRVNIENGYYQERYISCLRLGRILKNIEDKRYYYLKGIDIDSERLECYYELMLHEYNKKNFNLGAGWGLMTSSSREIKSSFMFAETSIYNYLFDVILSVCCYYSKYYEQGYFACLRSIEGSKNDNGYHTLAKNNLKFFTPYINNNIISPPKQELIIIENFYENPDKVRQDALNSDYPIKGNYPGQRSKPLFYDNIKEKFENIIGRKITYWPIDNYNGSFQWVNEDNVSWIHRDRTDWSAIVFLTPNAPKNGGTKFFIHKETGKSYADTSEIEDIMNKSTYKPNDWELVDTVGNIYNRCVLFRGKRSHISDMYFGKNLNDGRLFQTFFFNDS